MELNPFVDFLGKYVMVTGASSGIGRAVALELARCGAKLILVSRNRELLEEAAAQMGQGKVQVLPLDLNNLSEIEPKVRALAKEVGRIYGLCNAAGVVETRPLSSIRFARFQSLLNVNLVAGVELTRVVTRRDIMEESGGAVVFVSSVYGKVGVPGQVAYSASKGAVTSAVKAMAVELSRRKIRVNALSPGFVHTKLTEGALSMLTKDQAEEIKKRHPLGTGRPEDVARMATFLLAPQSAWITGADFVVDGGYTAQ